MRGWRKKGGERKASRTHPLFFCVPRLSDRLPAIAKDWNCEALEAKLRTINICQMRIKTLCYTQRENEEEQNKPSFFFSCVLYLALGTHRAIFFSTTTTPLIFVYAVTVTTTSWKDEEELWDVGQFHCQMIAPALVNKGQQASPSESGRPWLGYHLRK